MLGENEVVMFARSLGGRFRISALLFGCLALALLVGGPCRATGPAGEHFEAPRLSAPPVIDGDLSDPIWTQAKKIDTPWYRSDEGVKAKDRTVVWIGCDDLALYVAFYAYGDPSKLTADVVRRDADLGNDDWVAVDLDPYMDRRSIYWFDVTPRGTQFDKIPGGSASKIEWKGDWQAAARIVGDGWTAEIAIPFAILGYRPNATQFGINLLRYSSAALELSMWADVGPVGDYSRMGVIGGLHLPEQPRPEPTLMAYILAQAERDEDLAVHSGIDGRYQPSASVTGLLSVNPDFSNVEQSVDTIDFSYSRRQLADSRPFFAEGGTYFDFGNYRYTLFDSREAIGAVDAGAKYIGRCGPWTAALLDAWSHARRNDFVGVVRHDFSQVSKIEMFASRVTGEGPANDVWGGEARAGSPGWQVSFEYAESALWDPAREITYGWRAETEVESRHWAGSLSITDVQPGFGPRDGYVPDDDIKGPGGYIEWHNDQATGRTKESTFFFDWADLYDHQGGLNFNERTVGGDVEFRRDLECGAYHSWGDRPPYSDWYNTIYAAVGTREVGRGVTVLYRWGDRAGGEYAFWRGIAGFRPRPGLYLSISHEVLDHAGDQGRQTIATFTYEISSERSISGRWIGRAGESNLSLAYRQAVRRGTDVYIIYGDPNAEKTTRRLTLKLLIPL
jgi:hypothetical protein